MKLMLKIFLFLLTCCQAVSAVENTTICKSDIVLAAGEITEIPLEMGNHVWKMSCSLVFSSFRSVTVGKGRSVYQGSCIRIDSTHIEIHTNAKTDVLQEKIKHNILIDKRLIVFVDQHYDITEIILVSETGKFSFTTRKLNGNYSPFIEAEAPLTVERFNFDISEDCAKKILYIGDSYAGGQSAARVPGALYLTFNIRSFMTSNMSGGNAPTLYKLLAEALRFMKPDYVVWASGMNDRDFAAWNEVTVKAIRLIESSGATPVLCTVPSVPSRDKSDINSYIRAGKYRYIDFSIAVSDDKGHWNSGMLAFDSVHPTELGATALAMRALVDFPELLNE